MHQLSFPLSAAVRSRIGFIACAIISGGTSVPFGILPSTMPGGSINHSGMTLVPPLDTSRIVPPGYSADSTTSWMASAAVSGVIAMSSLIPNRFPDPGVPVVQIGVDTMLVHVESVSSEPRPSGRTQTHPGQTATTLTPWTCWASPRLRVNPTTACFVAL